MKTQLDSYRGQRGYVLILTLVFVGLGVLLLTTLMNWTAETSHLTDRNNQYFLSTAAAAGPPPRKFWCISPRIILTTGKPPFTRIWRITAP